MTERINRQNSDNWRKQAQRELDDQINQVEVILENAKVQAESPDAISKMGERYSKFVMVLLRVNFGILAALVTILTLLSSEPNPAELFEEVFTWLTIIFSSAIACLLIRWGIDQTIAKSLTRSKLMDRDLGAVKSLIRDLRRRRDEIDKKGGLTEWVRNEEASLPDKSDLEKIYEEIGHYIDELEDQTRRQQSIHERTEEIEKMVRRMTLTDLFTTGLSLFSVFMVAFHLLR